MKFLVIGDLHGRFPILTTKDFDAIIMVGDVCDDKKLAPIYKKWFEECNKNSSSTTKDMKEFVKKFYPNKDWDILLESSLKKGRKILERLNKLNKPIFFVPGNYDQSYGKTRIKNENFDKTNYNYRKSFFDFWLGKETNKKLISGLKNIYDLQHNLICWNNINFIGHGLVSAPEWSSKFNKKRKFFFSAKEREKLMKTYFKLENVVVDLFRKRNKKNLTIFISHNIPYNTKLDKIKDKKSYAHEMHLGSSLARKMCFRFKPEICFGGHIHEGKGRDKLGKTIIVNPGYGPGAQVLVEIDREKRKIKKVSFLK